MNKSLSETLENLSEHEPVFYEPYDLGETNERNKKNIEGLHKE